MFLNRVGVKIVDRLFFVREFFLLGIDILEIFFKVVRGGLIKDSGI